MSGRCRFALAATLMLGLAVPASAGSQPVRWGPLPVTLDGPADSSAVVRALDLEGRSVTEAPLPGGIRRALQHLAREGYPFARIFPTAFHEDSGLLTATLRVELGSAPRLAGLRLTGHRVTRESTARRLAGLRLGEPYTGVEERRVRERLSRSGLFQFVGEVEVVPGEAAHEVILEVPVAEPAYTRFSGVLGVSGRDARLTGLLDLDLANIAGSARAASGRWESRGDGLTRFALGYREPWLPYVPIGLSGSLAHDVNEGVYSYTKWEVAGDITWAGQWRFRLGRGGSRAVETASSTGSISEGYLLAGMAWDRRNSAINPTDGFRLSLESRTGRKQFTPFGDSLAVRLDRSRWEVEGETLHRVGRRWLAMLRTRFVYLDTAEDSIPRWDLFAIGGATTLRGYREEQFLTPAALTLQGEWRWLQGTRGSSLYGFADAGLISPRDGRLRDALDRFELGFGVGVRQANRIGIFGVEYGIARGDSPLNGRIHLRLDAVF